MYIDKKKFHNLLKEYDKTGSKKAYEEIGKYFIMIAENFLNKPSYINYSKDWKDGMISESLYDMVRYIHNYDIEKVERIERETGELPNPFAYFSQYAFNGTSRFLGVRSKDKEVLVRLSFIENME